jgi:hypothetical protein
MNVVLSFFNLKIELLIEGMKGAICCADYKFHEERGYNDVYFDQVQRDVPGHLSSLTHAIK